MIEFNIYFCIKQGKSVTFSTLELALDVRRLLVLNFGHSPLYRHFCKCQYIEMLKILLIY